MQGYSAPAIPEQDQRLQVPAAKMHCTGCGTSCRLQLASSSIGRGMQDLPASAFLSVVYFQLHMLVKKE